MTNTIVTIDSETSGLGHLGNPQRPDAILQVGYAWRTPSGEVERWFVTCNPGDEWLASGRADIALRINRLTREEIAAAPSSHEAANMLRERLSVIANSTGQPIELRAYNRAFDQPFFAADPWNFGDESFGPCIMLAAARHLDGPFGRWPKLVDAVSRLGLQWPDGEAHNAAVDSHAALLVHEAMLATTEVRQ